MGQNFWYNTRKMQKKKSPCTSWTLLKKGQLICCCCSSFRAESELWNHASQLFEERAVLRQNNFFLFLVVIACHSHCAQRGEAYSSDNSTLTLLPWTLTPPRPGTIGNPLKRPIAVHRSVCVLLSSFYINVLRLHLFFSLLLKTIETFVRLKQRLEPTRHSEH